MRYAIIIGIAIVLAGCTKDKEIPVGTGNQIQLTTKKVYNITQNEAYIDASINANRYGYPSISRNGIVVGTQENPVLTDLSRNYFSGMGDYYSIYTNLKPATKYYARAFAVLDYKVAIYGNTIEFTTRPIDLATVVGYSVSSITRNTAVLSSGITSAGGGQINARGACWATTTNPTLSNTYVMSGSGTGNFTTTLSGLTPATTYYVRAFASNEAGVAYGPLYSFKTSN